MLTDTKRPKIFDKFVVCGDQQLSSAHVQDRRLTSACSSEELDEYQRIMTSMAQEVSDTLRRIDNRILSWPASDSHWVMPGPFQEDRNFYFDLATGEAIFAQSDDILTESDIIKYWALVEQADRMKARSVFDNDCFKAVHRNCLDSSNVVDAT